MTAELLILAVMMAGPAAGSALVVFAQRTGAGHPSCRACGYNLNAIVGRVERCPECGARLTDDQVLPPGGDIDHRMLVTGLALCVAPMVLTAVVLAAAAVVFSD